MFRATLVTFITVRVNVAGDQADFFCLTDMKLGTLVSPEKKGIAIDDMTLKNCSPAMISQWPNTYGLHEKPSTPVRTVRIFKVWTPEWPAEERWKAWNDLLHYIKGNNMTVLLGTSIGCSEAFDKRTWEWTKEFMRHLGHENIMGVAIGNELEMFHRFREELSVTDECLDKLWAGGYAFNWFQKVVDEMDNMGMRLDGIPVTSVFGGLALAGNSTPFIDTPEAAVNTFLSQVVRKYGQRFVFTFNFYPYFDPNMEFDNGTLDHCIGSLGNALSWEYDGNVPQVTAVARRKMTNLTGNATWRMWLGETGWSSPLAPSLISQMKDCAQFSSIGTFREFYKGFLAWNLSISNATDPLQPPEHVFYFTMRDSAVFGVQEYFGLMHRCGDTNCKLTRASASSGPTAEEVIALAKQMQLAKDARTQSDDDENLATRFPGHLFSILEAVHLSEQTCYEAMYLPGEDGNSVYHGGAPIWNVLCIIGMLLAAAGAIFGVVMMYLYLGKRKKARKGRSARDESGTQSCPTATVTAAGAPLPVYAQVPAVPALEHRQVQMFTRSPASHNNVAAAVIMQYRQPLPTQLSTFAGHQPHLLQMQQQPFLWPGWRGNVITVPHGQQQQQHQPWPSS